MKWVFNVAKNDDAVKFVFDYMRNLGIVAALLLAAIWRVEHPRSTTLFWIDLASVLVVVALSLWLFLLNAAYAAGG